MNNKLILDQNRLDRMASGQGARPITFMENRISSRAVMILALAFAVMFGSCQHHRPTTTPLTDIIDQTDEMILSKLCALTWCACSDTSFPYSDYGSQCSLGRMSAAKIFPYYLMYDPKGANAGEMKTVNLRIHKTILFTLLQWTASAIRNHLYIHSLVSPPEQHQPHHSADNERLFDMLRSISATDAASLDFSWSKTCDRMKYLQQVHFSIVVLKRLYGKPLTSSLPIN